MRFRQPVASRALQALRHRVAVPIRRWLFPQCDVARPVRQRPCAGLALRRLRLRSSRTLFEATLFVLALVLALVGGFGTAGEDIANTFYFAAWCAALLLLFSLGLRLPLYVRSGPAR